MSLQQRDDVINNARKLAEFLNNAYINVVENTAGKKPLSFLDKDNVTSSTEGLEQFWEGFTDVSTQAKCAPSKKRRTKGRWYKSVQDNWVQEKALKSKKHMSKEHRTEKR